MVKNKMNCKRYYKVETVAKSNRRKPNRYSNTQIHDRSLPWLGTGTSIKSGEIKLV